MYREVALILLYDREMRFLLQHRTPDAWIMPDHWALFGGGLKKGETPEIAVKRETFEELNYKLKAPELVVEQDFKQDKVEGHMYVYTEDFFYDKSILALQEGQGWGWFKRIEMSTLKMVDRDRQVICFVEAFLKQQINERDVYQ